MSRRKRKHTSESDDNTQPGEIDSVASEQFAPEVSSADADELSAQEHNAVEAKADADGVLDADDVIEDEPDESDDDESDVYVFDADAEDAAEERARLRETLNAADGEGDAFDDIAPGGGPREMAELMAIIEALIFVTQSKLLRKC